MTKAPVRTVVLSAHAGGQQWLRTLEAMALTGRVEIRSCHGFDDRTYRKPRSLAGRALLRLRIYVLYPLWCCWFLLFARRHYDCILAVTSPFYLPAIACALGRRPVVTLQNDIYPEALVLSGLLRRGSWPERGLRALCARAARHSAAAVFISDAHRAHMATCGGGNPLACVIPVGATGAPFADHPPQPAGEVAVLYCGTMGLMHDPGTVLAMLSASGLPSGSVLRFHASGALWAGFARDLRQHHGALLDSGRLVIGEPLDDVAWAERMRSCQVGLVLQSAGAEAVVFPSKAFSILVAGQAMLAVAGPASELSRLITAHDCGWAVVPGDAAGLHAALVQALDPQVLARKRTNAFALGHQRFTVEAQGAVWADLLESSAHASTDHRP